jgi:hypothetical protein
VGRLSPLDVSARILTHVRQAWDHAHPEAPLAQQEVVLTVPASFDEVARELTVKAAHLAGLPRVLLLEEPQAAFHDFVGAQEDRLDVALSGVRLVLVVDVGGGTTDLTLVEVSRRTGSGEVALKRIAVGDHILLGGDNMDLSLARLCERRALGDTGKLDAAQWSQMVHVCRLAKQALLSDKGGPQKYGVSVAGRGSKLVGSAIKADLTREDALSVLLDGFLPLEAALPARRPARSGGLMEMGLPYAQDAAIPHHVSAFLWRHAVEARAALGLPADSTDLPRPDAILLNGGVFRAGAIRTRFSEVLARWFPGSNGVPYLAHTSLDASVARGAVYHGLTRRGLGHRITGGTARAYYLGLDGNRALCVVPRGFEGTEDITVPRTFALTVGKPARFTLYASSSGADPVGALVEPNADMELLPPIQTVLQGKGGEVPVQLHVRVTEIGTLELSCVADAQRWGLEFQLRAGTAPLDESRVEGEISASHKGLPEARDWIDRVYGKRPQAVEARDVKGLFRTLTRTLGEREDWNLATLRELYAATWAGVDRRRRSADHEKLWFQLAGYCLRPGFGAPLDAFRVQDLWRVFDAGLTYVNETPNWLEWWVLWRRVSGGLNRAQQEHILEALTPYLKPHTGRTPPPKPKGPRAQGREEMVRLVVSLERLSSESKSEVGRWLLADLEAPDNERRSWWALGRLGARVPLQAGVATVVKREKAEAWLEKLLARDWARTEGAAFASAMLARRTGDRDRDVAEELRTRVAERLGKTAGAERWVELVTTGGAQMQVEDQGRLMGESLPSGLRLMEGTDTLA